MVNRYDADGCQSAIGNYVSYEDYAALANAHQALDADFQDYITTTEMELKELREKLGLSS